MLRLPRLLAFGIAVAVLVGWTAPASATLVYSDLFNWWSDGKVVQHDLLTGEVFTLRPPGSGDPVRGTPDDPRTLLIKIEEDVITYDPVTHPFVTPGKDRYVYTITNLAFDSGNVDYNFVDQYGAPGPSAGVGVNGLSGFHIQNIFGVIVGLLGAPIDPVSTDPWAVGFNGAEVFWDIPSVIGEGIASPEPGSPLSLNSFFFEVDAGTPHGVLPAYVHSHDVDGFPVNYMTGYVSGPVPEPSTWLLLSTGLFGLLVAGRARRS